MKNKLIYICENDLSQQIGGTIHVKEVLQSLSKLNQNIILIAPDYRHDGSVEKNIQHKKKIIIKTPKVRIIRWLYFYIISTFKILQIYRKEKNIVIYSREMIYNIFLSILAKMHKIPFFIELNGILLKEMKDLGYSKSSYLFTKQIEKFILKSATKIISVSDEIKHDVIDLHKIKSQKIISIPNGADVNIFHPTDKIESKKICKINNDRFIIGFIGSCYPFHDIDTLINAVPSLIKKIPNLLIVIIGDGFMLKLWKELAERLKMNNFITFTGKVPYTLANDYINSFDICFGSDKAETSGFPMKTLHYLSCNKPIVTSNIESIKKYYEETPFFKMIEPENKEALTKAIIDLYNKRNEPVTGHRQMVIDNYTWDHTAKKIIRVIEDCC